MLKSGRVAMTDDQFHEFHLEGKQLVFLFMASIVVAVVIFLCGVMVGRGVRAPRLNEPVDLAAAAVVDPTATAGGTGDASKSEGTPSPQPEELTYPTRLGGPAPKEALDEPVRPAPEPPAPRPPRAGAAASRQTARNDYVVQVMSVTQRDVAETTRKSLVSKGYPAFVSEITQGGLLFRVRVGPYADEREAQAVADRLKREGKFKEPWVTH